MDEIVKTSLKLISLEFEKGISFDDLYDQVLKINRGNISFKKDDLLKHLRKVPQILISESLMGSVHLEANEALQSYYSKTEVIKTNFSSDVEFIKNIQQLYRLIIGSKQKGITYQALCDAFNRTESEENQLKMPMMSHYCKKLQQCRLVDIIHRDSKRLVTAKIYLPDEPFKVKSSRKQAKSFFKVEKNVNGTYRLFPANQQTDDKWGIKSNVEGKSRDDSLMEEEMLEDKSSNEESNSQEPENYVPSQTKFESLYGKSFMFRELTLIQNFHLNLSGAEANSKKGLNLKEFGQRLARNREKKLLARFVKKVQQSNIINLEAESYRFGKTFSFKYLVRDSRYKSLLQKKKMLEGASNPEYSEELIPSARARPSSSTSGNARAPPKQDRLEEERFIESQQQGTEPIVIEPERKELLNVESFLKMLRYFPEDEKLRKKLFSFVRESVFTEFLNYPVMDATLPPEKAFGLSDCAQRERQYRELSDVMIKITIENIEFSEVRGLAETNSKHSKRQVCGSKLNRYIFVLNKMQEKKVILSSELRNQIIEHEMNLQMGSVDRKTLKYILKSLEKLGILTVEKREMNKSERMNPIWNYRKDLGKSANGLNYVIEVVFFNSPRDYSEAFIAQCISSGVQNIYKRKVCTTQPQLVNIVWDKLNRKKRKPNLGFDSPLAASNSKMLNLFDKFETFNTKLEIFSKIPGRDTKRILKNFDFQLCKVMAFEYKVIIMVRFLVKLNAKIEEKNKANASEFLRKIKPDWNQYFLSRLFSRPANERKYGSFVSSLDREIGCTKNFLNHRNFMQVGMHKKLSIKPQPSVHANPGSFEETLRKIDELIADEDDFYASIGDVGSRAHKTWSSDCEIGTKSAIKLNKYLEDTLVDDQKTHNELLFLADINSKADTSLDDKAKFQEAFQALFRYLMKNPMKNFRDLRLKLKMPKVLNLTKVFSILIFEGMAEVWTFQGEGRVHTVVSENEIYSVLENHDWSQVFYKISLAFYSYL